MSKDRARYGSGAKIFHGVVLAALMGAGFYLPHAAFKVTPFPTGNAGPKIPGGVTSHTPSETVTVFEEDALERQVRADTFKWCAFCHAMEPNAPHKLGPTLYGVVGQQAGTTPNYINYSDAMMAARARGLVWDDEAIAAYASDPAEFLPGTNMIISIGTIEDPEVLDRLVNILKKKTMGDRAVEVARPAEGRHSPRPARGGDAGAGADAPEE